MRFIGGRDDDDKLPGLQGGDERDDVDKKVSATSRCMEKNFLKNHIKLKIISVPTKLRHDYVNQSLPR